MVITHLLASPFVGGPERQVLGVARHLSGVHQSVFLSFSESGMARDFLAEAAAAGFETIELRENWPHIFRAVDEVAGHLRHHASSVICTSGYKPDLIGLWAARRVGIPAVAIAHGWTAATWKVRLNELLDRWLMRRFDCVVSVSQAQARRVQLAGVRPERMVTIPNAVELDGQIIPSARNRALLESFFADRPQTIVVAAGRLSPEKGFDLFVDTAHAMREHGDVGFLLFGDGPLREALTRQIEMRNLQHCCILAGFRSDLHRLLPYADVLVLSSHTEGLPVIVLESLAAGVPVVATAVGGVPEVIEDGIQGFLVNPGDVGMLTQRLRQLIVDSELRRRMGVAGRERVAAEFSVTMQSQRYQQVFEKLCHPS